jgi:hypothetical protein
MRKAVLLLAALVLLVQAAIADARVVKLVVEKTRPFADGKSFGDTGPYERLDGTVYLEVDPRDPRNAVIVNLDKAPRNARGMVEFSSQFFIIKPVDMKRGNRKLFYGINNRGNNIEFTHFTYPVLPQGVSQESTDGLIFRLGYTYVDAGWAGDITTTATRLGANLPVAVQADGRRIVAPIRIEYQATGFTLPLKGNSQFRTYETADTDTAKSTLTVRDQVRGTRRPVPADQWAFGRCPDGKASLTKTTTDICLFEGFKRDLIYELIYPATNPWVMGLGYAVTRDVASFLKYETMDGGGNRNPLAVDGNSTGIRRAYAFGTSSTGMYLRDWLYLGFNEDEAKRKVFDAVRVGDPGTHRLFANVEFSDPNIYSREDDHNDFLSHSIPPLTYAVTTDPITGKTDGILKRPATDPLVIQVDTANEFWQMNASLNVHDGLGKPVAVPDNVRMYFLSNHSHTGAAGVAATPTAKGTCEHATNGARSFETFYRAMIVVLDEWADKGTQPPKSVYPDVRHGTLVLPAEAARTFPQIPGVRFPTVINQLSELDFGPHFASVGGWLIQLPPKKGTVYEARVPMVDKDGTDLGGVRTVDIQVPVGTNLGWNLRAAGPRGTDLCGLSGAFVPLARTKAERVAAGDPRESLEERYKTHAGFVNAVKDAARRLVKERFLLEEDAQTAIRTAEDSHILKSQSSTSTRVSAK